MPCRKNQPTLTKMNDQEFFNIAKASGVASTISHAKGKTLLKLVRRSMSGAN
jgi:hypothetical protein